ncbi:MAG TPA: dihydroorotase family protein [Gammaproteobacteria bacterium]|jgi:allantoinase|nr:hydantoinase [Chromatiales bacterium]MCP4927119.1 dihydroorotase family protein [Gammaproteobacteria bacterium]MDP7154039.1 dihydroorotase family protein [Gammaproteobacteria bacterium]HJP38903.1 dihydroorotase family protein [Gammaproteobacteria bacterium]
MSNNKEFDLLIKNVRVARATGNGLEEADIAIKDGKFVKIAPNLAADSAAEVYDGQDRIAFPGVVDPHMHTGIYSPLAEDAITESRAAAMGGVTSSLNYIRTGGYYLNKGGPYGEFMPEVLDISNGRFHVDYTYHIAPMDRHHIAEIPSLVKEFGQLSYKIYMFYGGHGLHGSAGDQHKFLMIDKEEKYDIAHFEFVMRGIQGAMEQFPEYADDMSLSMHCETAEIMAAYTKIVEKDSSLSGLAAYSASRPPHSEGLAIFIAAYLADETNLPNLNLLHLTSAKAVRAAMQMQAVFPHIDFRREVTIGHLMLDIDAPTGNLAKVNPPIRPREDVENLWENMLEGNLSWVCSDHACCKHEMKVDQEDPGNVWLAKSGFGGTEYLLSAFASEGHKRGMSYNDIAKMSSLTAARRFGLHSKGDIAEGLDGDVVLVDPNETWTVRAADSESQQGHTPFEGQELKARVKTTFLRGQRVFDNNEILGEPTGQYLHRPY